MDIIFDLGGVILTWQPRQLLKRIFPDAAMHERIWQGMFNHPDWLEFDRGSFDNEEACRRFTANTGLPQAVISRLLEAVPPSLIPLRGSVELLYSLKQQGRRLYCLSNMNLPASRYLQATFDFWEVFSGIVISCHINRIKPEVGIYTWLLDKYQLQPQNCLFIDDTQANLDAAAALSLKTLLFRDSADCGERIKKILISPIS